MSAAAIGNTLKEARTKKSMSLDEIHAKIKIHPRVLQLLEEGKFEKLPSPLFAKSFLRSYAEFLGVNPDQIIDEYGKEAEIAKKEPDQVLFIKSVDEKREFAWENSNITKIAVLAAAIIFGGLLAVFVVKHVPGWTQKIKVPDAKAWFSRKTHGADAAKLSAGKAAQEAKKKEFKKSEEWARSPEQGNFPKIPKKAALDLRVRALDNVWVRVTSDGKVLYQGILGRNAVETWSAKDTLELWTGNASNMFLSVNRYSLGSPGHGMIRKMVITREGVHIPAA